MPNSTYNSPTHTTYIVYFQLTARRTNEEASQTCQSTPISSSSQIQPMAEDIQDDSEPPPDFKPPPPPGRGSNNV